MLHSFITWEIYMLCRGNGYEFLSSLSKFPHKKVKGGKEDPILGHQIDIKEEIHQLHDTMLVILWRTH